MTIELRPSHVVTQCYIFEIVNKRMHYIRNQKVCLLVKNKKSCVSLKTIKDSWLGRHGRVVVGFYNYLCNQYLSPLMLKPHSGEVYSIQQYVMKFVSDL